MATATFLECMSECHSCSTWYKNGTLHVCEYYDDDIITENGFSTDLIIDPETGEEYSEVSLAYDFISTQFDGSAEDEQNLDELQCEFDKVSSPPTLEVCKYFALGRCSRGITCRYAHVGTRTPIKCKFGKSCRNPTACKFSHEA